MYVRIKKFTCTHILIGLSYSIILHSSYMLSLSLYTNFRNTMNLIITRAISFRSLIIHKNYHKFQIQSINYKHNLHKYITVFVPDHVYIGVIKIHHLVVNMKMLRKLITQTNREKIKQKTFKKYIFSWDYKHVNIYKFFRGL